jgi:hypothetical protein
VSSAGDAISHLCRDNSYTTEDLARVAASSNASGLAISEVGAVVVDWAGKSVRTSMDASRDLLKCRSVGQLAEAQMTFVSSVMRNWMEGRTQVLDITAALPSRRSAHSNQVTRGRVIVLRASLARLAHS